MSDLFLDTNLIIRAFTRDNLDQAERARRIFLQVEEGLLTIVTCEAVIVETVQVLSSKALYALPREDIRRHLSTLLALDGLRLPNKTAHLRALDLYATTKLEFVDALNVAHMEHAGLDTILSFDRDFDRVPGITRREP